MKIRFSISLKLLLFIFPLVLIPVATVGFFSMRASVDRVNRLVRHEQMVEVKTAANRINDVFFYCRTDLETISRLPVLEDYSIARSFRLEAEADFNRDSIIRLSEDFIGRTPYYYRIRYLDDQGRELIGVGRKGPEAAYEKRTERALLEKISTMGPDEIYFSEIVHSELRKGFLIHCAAPFFGSSKELEGMVVIDLDYERLMDIVRAIRVGENGYAFLVDQKGRSIAHPRFKPYSHNLENYPDPSVKALVLDMTAGKIGWKSYFLEGENKVAAFAPIPNIGWSLAVTIPSDEFRKEAHAIQNRVIQVVVFTLILTAAGVSILSYNLLRPVRNLVSATNRIASGDLRQEIPVQSRDELGDLTISFNRMVRNLSRIQQELVRSEKLISLGRLSAGVAHEIRNPLNAIKGAIVFLQRRRSNDSLIREYTQLISEEIDRLNRFVTEFLYFARQSVPKKTPTDVNKLISSVQSLFQKEAQERNISFRNQLDPTIPVMLIDPDQMERVLVNLITNAMDAMPNGGDLIFSSSLIGSGDGERLVRVKVRDRGAGIPRAHLKSLFDPFFSTKESGTGLGLPLSLGIVENHGGKIRIASREGLGTTVTIDWPLETNEPEDV